jgi:antitoxin VapB
MPGVREDRKDFDAPPARAKLFQHGGSQAVRLPKAFRFEGSEVTVRREGDRVILEPIKQRHPRTPEEWTAFWAEIDALVGDEPIVRPPQPEWTERDTER